MNAERHNGDDLYEDKFARVYAEVVRIDQLRQSDSASQARLNQEQIRRLDERMDSADKAVGAALAAAEKAVAAALAASEKGVTKAEAAQQKVNETQNEFRGTLRDQATQFMPRSETENLIRELRGLIVAQQNTVTDLRSRLDVGPPTMHELQSRSDEGIGRQSAIAASRALIFAIIAAIVGASGLIFGIVSIVTGSK
jgi:uncharacterized coiled-coil protein SlyX